MSNSGWVGVDFDATLAHYDGWVSFEHCGNPIPLMVDRVKRLLKQGREVRIFTARIFPLNTCIMPDTEYDFSKLEGDKQRIRGAISAYKAIQEWSAMHLGQVIPITNIKDYSMVMLYDDRAIGVVANAGTLVG